MSKVVRLDARRPRLTEDGFPTFVKIVDGMPVECVDVDALSPSERARWWAIQERKPGGAKP